MRLASCHAAWGRFNLVRHGHFSLEPVFTCFHDQRLSGILFHRGQLDQFIYSQLGQIVTRVNLVFGQLGEQVGVDAVQTLQVECNIFDLFFI